MYGLMIYSLKVGACLAVFYLFFKLLLSRETFHRLNRVVLLAVMVLSFVLPLCVITIYRELPVLPEQPATPVMYETPARPQPDPFPWDTVAAAVFLTGAGATLLWTLCSVIGVGRMIRRGRRERLDAGSVLVRSDRPVTPFSWWRYIVLSEKDLAENGEAIIRHERAHLRLRHSLDLLVIDIAGCLQWFNPAMWLLRRELRAIHEYEADEAVLDSGVDARSYQMLLIKKAAGGRWYSIANSFNHSKLKNRITMMLRKKSSRWAGAKTLLLLPLTGIALGAFARTAYVFPEDKGTKNRIIITKSSGEISDNKPLILVDGREVASLDSLDSERIASVSVLKDASATAIYGTRGINGVILVSTKDAQSDADGQTAVDGESTRVVVRGAGKMSDVRVVGFSTRAREAEDPAGETVVRNVAELPGTPGSETRSDDTRHYTLDSDGDRVSITLTDSAFPANDTTRYKIRSVTTSRFAAGGDEAANILWIVDGKEIAAPGDADLDPDRIASIRVLKGASAAEKYAGRGFDGVIEITTKKAGAAAKGRRAASVTVTSVGADAGERTASVTEASLQAAEEGLKAARAGLEMARKYMPGKEWRQAQAELDKAQKELATARRTSAAELAAAREQLEAAHIHTAGDAWNGTQGNDGMSQSRTAGEVSGPDAKKSQDWHVTTGLGTTRVDHSMTKTGKTTFSGQVTLHNSSEIPDDYLIFINGEKASKEDVRRIAPKKIKRMELLRGRENCKQYGADVEGVVRITTRR